MVQSAFDGAGKGRRWLGLAAMVLVVAGGSAYWVGRSPGSSQSTPVVTTTLPTTRTVTALGRLEPKGEIIQLSAPANNSSNRVEQILVQEGDRVQAGQVIAILDSRDRLEATYEQALEEVNVAQSKLAITQAGAKQGEIAAQQAEIERLTAQQQGEITAQAATVARLSSELRNAETEYTRYQSLYQQGAISASNLDSKRLTWETAQKNVQEAQAVLNRIQSTSPAQLNQAKATLARIAEVRPVDVQASQAEVDRAVANLKQAKAELANAFVRSPISGEVLDIHAQAGEVVGTEGIAEIGQTQQMYAIAEVYQSDIQKIKPGQAAIVSGESFMGDLTGQVERIDSQIRRQTVVNTDPSANVDARVVEVHIALDSASSRKAAKLTNLQVTTEITYE